MRNVRMLQRFGDGFAVGRSPAIIVIAVLSIIPAPSGPRIIALTIFTIGRLQLGQLWLSEY
jgi:hypothetical protein